MSIRSKRSKGGDGSAEKGTKLQPARTNYCLELNLLKHHRDATHAADTGLRVLSAEEEASGICSVLRAMYAASPDGILVVTAQGTVLSYNRKLAEIWRMPLEHTEVCESSLLAITNGAILTMASDRVKTPRAFADRVKDLYAHPDQEDHCEIELRDGRTLERHSSPLRTQQGKSLGRVWFYRDITERKRYEQELLRSERDARERLAEIEQIYQHSPVGLGLLDSAYRHVRINDRLAAMAGMKGERVCRQNGTAVCSGTRRQDHCRQPASIRAGQIDTGSGTLRPCPRWPWQGLRAGQLCALSRRERRDNRPYCFRSRHHTAQISGTVRAPFGSRIRNSLQLRQRRDLYRSPQRSPHCGGQCNRMQSLWLQQRGTAEHADRRDRVNRWRSDCAGAPRADCQGGRVPLYIRAPAQGWLAGSCRGQYPQM